jgi:small nuclear ribonucleoprotein (snRNP)-like protein
MVKMTNKIQRPFDFLEEVKGKRVLIETDGCKFVGILRLFDTHLNVVLENVLVNDEVKLPVVFLRTVKSFITL